MVEYMDTKSIFIHEKSVYGNRYQTSVSQKTTTLICLRRDGAPTLLLDGVIFDIIGGSLKNEHLALSIVLFLKNL